MAILLAYSGIVTKVRAMQANLLTKEQYSQIAHLHGVPEVLNFLKKQPAYSEILGQLDESKIHRGDIEKVLTQSIYKDYAKLYRFSGLTHRKFLKLYLKHYELDVINYCLRIIFNHYEQPFDLNYKKDFFERYSGIHLDALISSRGLEDFVQALEGTDYYPVLRKLLDAKVNSLYDYNIALDLHYFSSIWKSRTKILKGKELDSFTKEFGTHVDLLNLQWIYRAKAYYQMESADIYSMIIPFHLHLPKAITKTLVESADLNAYINEVKQSYYGKRWNLDSNQTIEKTYVEYLTKLYMNERRKNPYSITSISTYLFLKEQETITLTHMMEGIRYQLPPEEILKHIGGVA